MITANCDHLPSIQKLYAKERTLESNSNRNSLTDLDQLIQKEQILSKQVNNFVSNERYCNSINWGFSGNYNWRR